MTELPQKLETHCRKTRSTFILKDSLENLENSSYEFDISNINQDYEKIERDMYGLTAKEASREFCTVYDDLIRYCNSTIYFQLKEIYLKEFDEDLFNTEIYGLFEEIMPLISETLDLVEMEIEKTLSIKDIPKVVTAIVLNEKKKQIELDKLDKNNPNENYNNYIKDDEKNYVNNKYNSLNNNVKQLKQSGMDLDPDFIDMNMIESKAINFSNKSAEKMLENDFFIEGVRSTDVFQEDFDKEIKEYDLLFEENKLLELELEMKKQYLQAYESLIIELEEKKKLEKIKNANIRNINDPKFPENSKDKNFDEISFEALKQKLLSIK